MSVNQSIGKPAKPYPEYPLFPHARGQWCKKYKGKQYSCGKWYDDDGNSNHVAALGRWGEIRNAIELGENPAPKSGVLTIDRLVNLYLDAQDAKLQAGEITERTFLQNKIRCAWLKKNIGEHRVVETVQPLDFIALKKKLNPKWSAVYCGDVMGAVRRVFGWAYDSDLIDRPVKYGKSFCVSAKRAKLERKAKPRKVFTAAEFWTFYAEADTSVRCWLWLGINAGYGNSDISRLTVADATGVWLDVHRAKTLEDRKCWLWPETRRAIRAVLEDHAGGESLFCSRKGRQLVADDGSGDEVAEVFKKLRRKCCVQRMGVGFYAWRHMTETIAGEAPNVSNLQVVVNHIMGHRDGTMGGIYRESISDDRVKKVCQHVRKWIMGAKPKGVKV